MLNKKELVQKLKQQGLLPLYYYEKKETSVHIMRSLYEAGIRIFEYTNRGEYALENFKQLIQIRNAEMPDLSIGIGTIKSIDDAEIFTSVGADFLVAPIINKEVAQFANAHQLLWIPGCMTPTEIFLAQEYKAAIIKLFPANILGTAFLSSIKELFAKQLFIPTGGVEVDATNIQNWFHAGVCAVGMGSKLINPEWIKTDDYKSLVAHTKNVLEMIAQVRS